MPKFLEKKWDDLKLWVQGNMPLIKYQLRSVSQSFLTGVALYIIANWGTITTMQWDKAAVVGMMIAVARSGVKYVWAIFEPKIISMLKKFTDKS